jgi:hypothetical protein
MTTSLLFEAELNPFRAASRVCNASSIGAPIVTQVHFSFCRAAFGALLVDGHVGHERVTKFG